MLRHLKPKTPLSALRSGAAERTEMPKKSTKPRSGHRTRSNGQDTPVKKPATRRPGIKKQDLQRFRSLVTTMRDETVSELDSLTESLMPEVVAVGEQPDEPLTSVQTVLMIQRQRKLLNLLEASLVRIAQGSYGTCSSCGNPIEMGRLEAIPYTTLCVECGKGKQE